MYIANPTPVTKVSAVFSLCYIQHKGIAGDAGADCLPASSL